MTLSVGIVHQVFEKLLISVLFIQMVSWPIDEKLAIKFVHKIRIKVVLIPSLFALYGNTTLDAKLSCEVVRVMVVLSLDFQHFVESISLLHKTILSFK